MPPPCRCSTPGSAPVTTGRTVDVQRDVVAVEPADDLDAALDALDFWHASHERAEQPLEALLGRRNELEQVLERRGRVDRRGRGRVGRPERRHRGDHPRVGPRVVPQGHVGRTQTSGKHR